MSLSHDDTDTLVVCSVRYALGRATYIVYDVCKIVRKTWSSLKQTTKTVVLKDIEDALKRVPEGEFLGHSCDHEQWSELKDWICVQEKTNTMKKGTVL